MGIASVSMYVYLQCWHKGDEVCPYVCKGPATFQEINDLFEKMYKRPLFLLFGIDLPFGPHGNSERLDFFTDISRASRNTNCTSPRKFLHRHYTYMGTINSCIYFVDHYSNFSIRFHRYGIFMQQNDYKIQLRKNRLFKNFGSE